MLLAYAGDDKKMVAVPPSSNQRGGRGGGGSNAPVAVDAGNVHIFGWQAK
jgi:hypothetical protein